MSKSVSWLSVVCGWLPSKTNLVTAKLLETSSGMTFLPIVILIVENVGLDINQNCKYYIFIQIQSNFQLTSFSHKEEDV